MSVDGDTEGTQSSRVPASSRGARSLFGPGRFARAWLRPVREFDWIARALPPPARSVRWPLIFALGFGAMGCVPVPTWSPSIRGRVVERATQTPVPGALVVAHYDIKFLFDDSTATRGPVRTNADGRFFIPGRPALLWLGPFLYQHFLPALDVYYPVYGSLIEQRKLTGLNSYRLEVDLLNPADGGSAAIPEHRDRSSSRGFGVPTYCDYEDNDNVCEKICAYVVGGSCSD